MKYYLLETNVRKPDVQYVVYTHIDRINEALYRAQLQRFIDEARVRLNATDVPVLDIDIAAKKDAIKELQRQIQIIDNELFAVSDKRLKAIKREFGISNTWWTTQAILEEAAKKIMEADQVQRRQVATDFKAQITSAINMARTAQGLALMLESLMLEYGVEDAGLKRYVDSLSIS